MESTLENDALASTKKPSCCSKSLPKLICEGGMGGGMGGREGGEGGMGGRDGRETNLHEEPNDQASNLPPLIPKTESTGQRDHTLTPSHPHTLTAMQWLT